MKLGRIGVASVIMALLIPIIGIDNRIMQEIAFYMIVIGITFISSRAGVLAISLLLS